MADGEEEEGEEKRLVDLRRSSLMASPQVKSNFSWDLKYNLCPLLAWCDGRVSK